MSVYIPPHVPSRCRGSHREPWPLQNAPPSSNILAFLVVSEASDEDARPLLGHDPVPIIALSLCVARCYRKMKSPASKLGIAAETTVEAPDPPDTCDGINYIDRHKSLFAG